MKELDFKLIGSKIKERRLYMNITQETMSSVLGVNPSHISNIECGRANPSLTALVRIANILECSIDYFISNEYSFESNQDNQNSLDDDIANKLKYCDIEKKRKISTIIDII